MQKIIFFKGLPASGKTTHAKQYCFDYPEFVRLNKDDIREDLGNPTWSKKFEDLVLQTQREKGLDLLKSGRSLIIDDTNFAEKHLTYWKGVANKHNCEFEVKFFDTPLETCITRDKNRLKPVGEGIIRKMYKQYLKPSNVKTDDRFTLDQNKFLLDVIICDIDGTLALMNGRSPFDGSKMHTDKVNESVAIILEDYSKDCHIILISGREEKDREVTEKWLKDNKIPVDVLYMRKSGDFRSDDIVKKEIYDEFIKDQYYVKFVLDDRDKVVKMWRSLGLLCLQVYYGDF